MSDDVSAPERALRALYRWMLAGAAVAMVLTLVFVLLGVAGRQLGFTVPGLDAYAGYAIAAALFLALPDTLQRGGHIRITLLTQRLPAGARRGVEVLCLALAVAVAAGLAAAAVRLVWFSHLTGDVSQGADATPLWLPQVLMAAGCLGLAVALLHALVAHLWQRPFFAPAAGSGDAGP